jgi:3D (Asp-Asp-Asp) domain-containing protein
VAAKRLLIVILLLFLICASQGYANEPADVSGDNIGIRNDGELIDFPDAKPIIDQQNRLQVPVRFLSEMLSCEVDWSMEGQRVKVSLSGPDCPGMELRTGLPVAIWNDRAIRLDSPPFITGGRVYVPLRFIAESFGMNVRWNETRSEADLDESSNLMAMSVQEKSKPVSDHKGRILTMEATAYTSSPAENGKWGAVDYFGNTLSLGTIAVDPSVIPLGTQMFITGYAFPDLPEGGFIATATDTGSAVKGEHIDIYVPSDRKQALKFGKQTVKLYILE